jgi:serine/threonine-protein phosphatase PP1 catalytic subunit
MASGKKLNKAVSKEESSLLLPKIDSIFESEPAVLQIDTEPIMIVGDIHGDLETLNLILGKREEMGLENILFLGDYVDRGPQGTEVLLKLFQMKIEDPKHIFLLRGNHETIEMNFYYGFFEEIGSDQAFIFRLSRTYDKMPVAAVLSGHTFCVHGGINGTGSRYHFKGGSFSLSLMTLQIAQALHTHLEVPQLRNSGLIL